jgi:hypothetical protein
MTHLALPRRGALMWTILSALGIVILGDCLFYQNQLFGSFLGVFDLALVAALLLRRSAVRRDRRALTALLFAALFACALIVRASPLPWFLFWIALGMATLLPSVARFDDGWRWFQRLCLHGLRATAAPMIDLARASKARRRSGRRRLSLARAFALLALPVGGSALVLMLFVAANPVLDALLSHWLAIDLSALNPFRFLFWALLFTLAWGVLRPRPTQHLLGTFDGSGDLPLPGVSIASVMLSLIAFNLLFAMQNLMDLAYLGGLVPLPDGVTLAGYAHRGAYPLIVTALLAALFVLVALRPGSRTASVPAIRVLVVLWIGQNILLVGSSAVRTLDYVAAYSLTPLRIAALAWMALVALGLLLICWRMLRARSASWLINANLAAATLMLTLFCFVDLGAVSAWWNVRHAREVGGRGAALDLCYLNRLRGSALLPLIAIESRPGLDPDFHVRVQVVRERVADGLAYDLSHGEWTWLGNRRMRLARQALAGMKPVKLARAPRACDGSLLPPPIVPAPPLQAALTAEKQP